jgi:two-component system phosphate regulon sensor histidine kinase PhoR
VSSTPLRPARRRFPAAARGAIVATAILLAAAILRDQLDLLTVAVAAVAVGAGAIGSRGTDRTTVVGQPSPGPPRGVDLVASCPDPVIIVDRRAVVLQFNEPARSILPGIAERHPLAFALRAPEVLDALPPIAAGEPARDVVFGGRTATEATFEVRLRRVLSHEGGPAPAASVALFFRDLTAERRLETMRVDFIANVSHELRTPLASLIGFIDTLQGPARRDDAAREKFLEIMSAQGRRMARLIDDLLRLSRIELRAHLAPAGTVDLAETTAHMVEVLAPLARERDVLIHFTAPPGPVPVRGERDELIRVVENLVENAIKYGGSGKHVHVEVGLTEPEGGSRRAQLSVRDEGPGISPEHLPRLTERFYRVDVAESRREGGTGLGLAIVKHIVNHHRGRLMVESEPGQGAVFRVTLPAADT